MPENGAQPWDFAHPSCPHRRDEYFWANPLHVTHPVQDAVAARIIADCFYGGAGAAERRGLDTAGGARRKGLTGTYCS